MKQLDFEYTTHIDFDGPVINHYFTLRSLPFHSSTLRVDRAHIETKPECKLAQQTDGFGNTITSGRIMDEHTFFSYSSLGSVIIDLSRTEQEDPHPMFRHPSQLATANDDIREFAHQAADAESDDNCRCEAVSHAVHEFMRYLPGTTDVRTTAQEAFSARRGVCQDFAHITIAALRSLGIPTRYVSGITVGEGETHAWLQANIDGYWRGFDPTRDQLVDETYLPLAVGRDWTDCPIENGSFMGMYGQHQTINASVKERIE